MVSVVFPLIFFSFRLVMHTHTMCLAILCAICLLTYVRNHWNQWLSIAAYQNPEISAHFLIAYKKVLEKKKTPPPQSTSLSHVFETSENMLKAHFTRTMGILISAVCFGFYHNYAIICTDNTLFFSEKPCLIILSYHMLC